MNIGFYFGLYISVLHFHHYHHYIVYQCQFLISKNDIKLQNILIDDLLVIRRFNFFLIQCSTSNTISYR